jgi:hypothetical protein
MVLQRFTVRTSSSLDLSYPPLPKLRRVRALFFHKDRVSTKSRVSSGRSKTCCTDDAPFLKKVFSTERAEVTSNRKSFTSF